MPLTRAARFALALAHARMIKRQPRPESRLAALKRDIHLEARRDKWRARMADIKPSKDGYYAGGAQTQVICTHRIDT